jgi:probable F420-dependent oxidoreductase
MKVGLLPVGFGVLADPDGLARAAVRAEDLGLHSLWAGEHVVFLPQYTSRYPYSAEGTLPDEVLKADFLDPFVCLSFVAAHTKRLRIGTGIAIIGERHPLHTAKAVASLDKLSKGRFDFGVGLGWLREEYEAVGVPWPRRVERTEEYLAVMKRVWTEAETAFDGEFCAFPSVYSFPKPVQKPHPPVIFGGQSEPALRRAARLGDGWYGLDLSAEDAIACAAQVRRYTAEAGRDPAALQFSLTPQPEAPLGAEELKRLADGGFSQLILRAFAPDADEMIALIERVARDVVEPGARI